MKTTHDWYKKEMTMCLKELLDEDLNPHSVQRGWLERADFVLDIIGTFISSSMLIGNNPLTALRKQFPFLDWKYVNYGSDRNVQKDLHFCKEVAYCDFFWYAIEGQGWHLIVSTRKEFSQGQTPRSLFGSVYQIESDEEFDGTNMVDAEYLYRYLTTKKIRDRK